MCLVRVYHSNVLLVEERTGLHTPLQQTNQQTLTTSKYKILINRRWEWIILSVRLLTIFEENIVVIVLAKLVLLFSKCAHALFFLTCSLIDRCQIVTDTCIIMFQSLFGSLLNKLYHYTNWKCFGEASPFNLHHLYFNYHLLAQKLLSLWKIMPYLKP